MANNEKKRKRTTTLFIEIGIPEEPKKKIIYIL